MTTQTKSGILSTAGLTRIAILAAVGVALSMLEFPIFAGAPFYKLDPSGLAIMLAGFSMGFPAGVLTLLIKDLVSLLVRPSGGWVGQLADFIALFAFSAPAVLIYFRNKNRKNALIGMAAGTLCMAVISVLVNKWIMLPFYMGAYHMDMSGILSYANTAGVDSEWKLLLMITAPFNLLKGAVLSAVTGLIYKPLSPLLHEKGNIR